MFGRGLVFLNTVSETILENRTLFTQFCTQLEMKVLNTCFRRQAEEICAFRENTTTHGPEWTPTRYAQIDFWLAGETFSKCCKDFRARMDLLYIYFQITTSWKHPLHLNCRVRLSNAFIDLSFAGQTRIEDRSGLETVQRRTHEPSVNISSDRTKLLAGSSYHYSDSSLKTLSVMRPHRFNHAAVKSQRVHLYIPLLCKHSSRTAHKSLKLVCDTSTRVI